MITLEKSLWHFILFLYYQFLWWMSLSQNLLFRFMSIRIYNNIVKNISRAFWLRYQKSKGSDFTLKFVKNLSHWWNTRQIYNNHKPVKPWAKMVEMHWKMYPTTHTVSKEINKQMDPPKESKGDSFNILSFVYLPYRHGHFSNQMDGAKHS